MVKSSIGSGQVAVLANRLSRRLVELTADVQAAIEDSIQPLRGDERLASLLQASVQENLGTMLHMLRHEMNMADATAPSAALEYARRLAQRDIAAGALIRAYRVGQAAFLKLCLEGLLENGEDDRIGGATTLQLVARVSEYGDRVVDQVVVAHEQARAQWLQHRGVVLATRVGLVLRERSVGAQAAEDALSYRMSQYHLGVVLWASEDDNAGFDQLMMLSRLADGLGRAAGCREAVLFIPCDERSAWVWLPLGERSEVARDALATVVVGSSSKIFAALGEPVRLVAGFRRTHRQACSAQSVALAGSSARKRLTSFVDIAPIASMCSDLEAARDWIAETLGALAIDDERRGLLRDTARVFLASGGSYAATAELSSLHRNTAQYRVRKAEECRGRPFREGRLDVELALLACHWLGQAVLQTSAQHEERSQVFRSGVHTFSG